MRAGNESQLPECTSSRNRHQQNAPATLGSAGDRKRVGGENKVCNTLATRNSTTQQLYRSLMTTCLTEHPCRASGAVDKTTNRPFIESNIFHRATLHCERSQDNNFKKNDTADKRRQLIDLRRRQAATVDVTSGSTGGPTTRGGNRRQRTVGDADGCWR